MYLKLILFGFLSLAFACSALAQQEPQFSQYMLNAPYWSVAFTGLEGKSSISAFSRNQWTGYDNTSNQDGGAPSTQFLNFTSPLTLFNTPLSLGANVVYDKLGPMANTEIQIGLAYHWELPRGTISAGIRPAIINQAVDFSKAEFLDQRDPRNTGSKESQFAMDLDLGVAYSTENYEIGLGVGHLMRPAFDYGLGDINNSNQPMSIKYNLYGVYNYAVSYRLVLSPSVLLQTDINSYTFNVGAVGKYSDKIWAGLSYKNAESVVFLFGYSFLNDNSLSVGYSFDYIINDKEAKAATSHELYLKFYLPSISSGSKKIIRTPRFRY